MFRFALAGSFVAAAHGAVVTPNFDDFAKEHGLGLDADSVGYEYRRERFNEAVKRVTEHNSKQGVKWKAALNKFSALSDAEMKQFFGYVQHSVPAATSERDITPPGKATTPPSDFDWRNNSPSVVTPVKSQGACGSCWAFAATATIESAIAIATGNLFDLSPQQMVSCMPNPHQCGGSGGCAGATAQLAFNYTVKAGITSIWNWPYFSGTERGNGECFEQRGRKRPIASISGYVQVPPNDGAALVRAVLQSPVSVSVAAGDWGMYGSGVFDGCDTSRPIINHAVVLVGYGEDPEHGPYWTIRNSWGVMWGEKGYIRLQRTPDDEPCGVDDEPLVGSACADAPPKSIKACGMCGVLSDSAYPIGDHLGRPHPPEDPALRSAARLFSASGLAPRAAAPDSYGAAVPPQAVLFGAPAVVALLALGFAAGRRAPGSQYSALSAGATTGAAA
mmetsp:Transcript_6931/g.19537  ORF Transcript_6931/g.19537 Transcript_6931/m.19537 type:complete len:447 (+) Transcript_6931:66-1406(+)